MDLGYLRVYGMMMQKMISNVSISLLIGEQKFGVYGFKRKEINSRVKTLQTFAVKLKIWDEKNCWNEKDGRRDMEFGGGAWGHTRQCVLGFTHIYL